MISAVPQGTADPFIANGVGEGRDVSLYFSSGIGPAARNLAAPAGLAERYIDTEQFPDGTLPEGVTVTEAQALNVFARIQENLKAHGLSVRDVMTLRIYTDAPSASSRCTPPHSTPSRYVPQPTERLPKHASLQAKRT